MVVVKVVRGAVLAVWSLLGRFSVSVDRSGGALEMNAEECWCCGSEVEGQTIAL